MIPTLALPGDRIPGQFGPIRRARPFFLIVLKTRSSSCAGMPSVIAMISSMPASSASRIESAANRGGTKIIAVLAPCSFDGLAEGVEDRDPVDVLAALARGHAGDDLGSVVAVAQRVEGALAPGDSRGDQARALVDEDAHTGLDSFESSTTFAAAPSIVDSVWTLGSAASASIARPSSPLVPSRRTTNGTVGLDLIERLDQPAGDLVAAGDPAEDVEQHRADLVVGKDHLDRAGDRVSFRAAPGVEEVGRRASRFGDDVERRHRQPGAVGEDADVAVELDVGESALLGHPLLRILLGGIAQLGVGGVAEQRVVIERDLRVERLDGPLRRDDQRVDLDERRLL